MPLPVALQVPTNFTWVCSSQRFYHPKFMQSFAQQGLQLLANPSTAELFDDMSIATTLHGFASHTIEADDAVCWAFIRALADRATGMLGQFRPQVCEPSALMPLALHSLLVSSSPHVPACAGCHEASRAATKSVYLQCFPQFCCSVHPES